MIKRTGWDEDADRIDLRDYCAEPLRLAAGWLDSAGPEPLAQTRKEARNGAEIILVGLAKLAREEGFFAEDEPQKKDREKNHGKESAR